MKKQIWNLQCPHQYKTSMTSMFQMLTTLVTRRIFNVQELSDMAVSCETLSPVTMIHKFVRQHWKFISKLTSAISCKFFFNESSWVVFISSNFGWEDCTIFLVCIIWFSCSIGINSCKTLYLIRVLLVLCNTITRVSLCYKGYMECK